MMFFLYIKTKLIFMKSCRGKGLLINGTSKVLARTKHTSGRYLFCTFMTFSQFKLYILQNIQTTKYTTNKRYVLISVRYTKPKRACMYELQTI